MSKKSLISTMAIQVTCLSIIGWLLLMQPQKSAEAFQLTTPEPFLGPVFYGERPVWQIFDHDLPLASNGDDGNHDVVHYNGTLYKAVTVTPLPPTPITSTPDPAGTPTPSPTEADPYIPISGYGYDGHAGIDFGLIYKPVLAAAPGVVQTAGWTVPNNHRAGYGLHVVMDHSGYTTWYGHLSSLTVQTGDDIDFEEFAEPNDRRRILGISGNTGSVFNSVGNVCGSGVENDKTCGYHLHFEVRQNNGLVVDPYGWVASPTGPDGTPTGDPWVTRSGESVTGYNLWATPPAVTSSQYQANGPVLAEPPPPTPYIIVDNADGDFSENPANCLQTETGGHNGDYRYMPVTDFTGTPPTPTCLARWAITPPNGTTSNDDLYYDVYVHIPKTTAHTLTRGAVYSVWHHPSGTAPLTESQAIVVQAVFPNDDYEPDEEGQGSPWVYIGRYFFTLDGTEYIEVGNVTLDGDVAGYVVAADAIQLSSNTLPPVNTATPSPSTTPTPSPTGSSTPAGTPTATGTPTIAVTPSSTPDPNYLTQISSASGGWHPAISGDGRYIAYFTDDGTGKLIRYDRVTGVAETVVSDILVSAIDISEDGRYIAYSASGVSSDIFLFDYQTGLTENISSSISPPSQSDILHNLNPYIAVDGGVPIVAFTSQLNYFNNTIYLYEPGQPLEEINPANLPNNPTKFVQDISANGNEILYKTTGQLFLFNRTTSAVQTIQPPITPTKIWSASLSSDPEGRYLVYLINVNGSCWFCFDEGKIYFYDKGTGLSEEIAFGLFHETSAFPHVSSDGRFVYYGSGDKILAYDRVNDVLLEVAQGFRDQSEDFDISSNGNFVVFPSDAPNNNGDFNVFLVDMSLWSPPVISTPTPFPTPTPTSTCIAQAVLLASKNPDANEGYAAKPDNSFLGKVQQSAELLSLLYRLRDDVMSQTQQGQAYITLYETHTDELSSLVLADSALYQQAYDTLTLFTPHFQDFLDGDGTNVTITATEIQAIQDFLDNVIAVGSPELQQTIAQERANLPLENFIGLTPNDAWNLFNNSGNLLQNEGFEEGLLYWQSGGNGNVSISNDAFAGNNALEIGSGTNSYQVVFDVVEVWTYTFSGWAKRTGGTQWAAAGLNFFDVNGNGLLIENVPITATGYEFFSISVVAPTNAVRVHARANIATGTGLLYLDSLTLEASSGTPPPTAIPTSTATSSPTATPTFTPTPPPSVTPTGTPTAASTATFTPTSTPTAVFTPSPPPTFTPTGSPTPTQSPGGGTFLFTPVADAFVAASQPNSNTGGSTQLRTDLTPENISYLKFDVQNLEGTISSVKLRLFVLDTNTLGFNVHRINDDSWAENTVTYNTRPALGLFIAASGAVSANSWVEIDVTEYVTSEGVFSFALMATNDAIIRYRSRETSSMPELIIETGSGATPTATPLPTFTPTVAATATPGTSPTPTQPPTATPTPVNIPTSTPTSLPGETVTFTPIADAFVNANQPTGNQGSSTTLRTDTIPDMRSYLKFDVQGLDGNIVNATLRIFAQDTASSGFEVYAVPSNSWSENTITYSNIPSTGMFITSSGATTANAWIEVDVTSFVTGNDVWSLVLVGVDDHNIRYRSRESSASPELIVETGQGSMSAEQTKGRVLATNAGKNQYE